MSLDRKLGQVLSRFHEIEALLATGALGSGEFTQLSKEYAELSPLAELIRNLKDAKVEMKDLEGIISDPLADKEMKSLAEEDFYRLKEEIPKLEKDIQFALIPKDEADVKSAILEIRAGTG